MLLASLLLAGCATPAERMDVEARSSGYARNVVQGSGFRHVVYANGRHAAGGVLHVYIDGDGSPYLDRWTVAADPTPRNPLMLRLMALDSAPAVYVGRPCYAGLATDPPCSPLDWTLGRFSERVVDSLATVIEQQRAATGASGLALFGHSGGGTLAVLIAARLPDVRRVITLAGNLDPDAWADLHEYTRLTASLNPVRLGPLPITIEQLHFAGARDRVMPPALIETAAGQLGARGVAVLPDVAHATGWEAKWPAILAGHWTDVR
jgi:pimeloyl-ACP methyl ester carboxylesterase